MTITIMPMVEADLPEVLKIERASFAAPWSQQMFEEELRLRQSQTFVAKLSCHPDPALAGEGSRGVARWGPSPAKAGSGRQPKVVGFICFWTLPGEIQILNIAVDPSFRKQGIGSELLKTVLGLVEEKGIREVTLETRASNDAALRLYQRFGFQICGRRKKYYHEEGEDALLLILRR